ncbi:unnamed protein product [Orchesella dallaii]|uniref:Uncharacterized protein n=1 Tax=Orchesella dallaii TaxID=48710 RepID=A0ABP1RDT7_9HEXA
MKLLLCVLVLIPFVIGEGYRRSNKRDNYVNSIAFEGSSFGGCRKKHPDNRSLPGGAEACASHKPLKLKGVEKIGKRLCADGYEYCSVSHKSLHRLSWKPEIMPRTCFGFHYKKNKFAGYGHNCHRNQYFDGLLCCPANTHKTAHNLRIQSPKLHHDRSLKNHHHNYVKK